MIARVLILTVLSALFVLAQPPRGYYPWWDRPIAKDLNLTADQSSQIRSTIRDYRGKLLDGRAALEKAERELREALELDQVDTQRANQAIEDLAHARGNLTRTFSQMTLQLRLVLTPQQWQELRKRRAAGEGRPYRRRFTPERK
jgi:Spy/CpxP family protein refolding chaperone